MILLQSTIEPNKRNCWVPKENYALNQINNSLFIHFFPILKGKVQALAPDDLGFSASPTAYFNQQWSHFWDFIITFSDYKNDI